MTVQHHVLSNGAHALINPNPHSSGASLGYFFRVGARHETKKENGVAHFLEHMAFKGTPTRDVKTLLEEMEDMGAQPNAFTSKEMTAYHMTGLAEDFSHMNDLVFDITKNSILPAAELETERGAIIQEIRSGNDDLGDVAYEQMERLAFPRGGLGATILGPIENIQNFTADTLHGFMDKNYHAGNLIVSVAGNVDAERVLQELEQTAGQFEQGQLRKNRKPTFGSGYVHVPRQETEQLNVSMAFQSCAQGDVNSPAAAIMGSILGGGMTSRLFWEVREKRGLVYSIGAGNMARTDHGLFMVVAGCDAEQGNEMMPVVAQEIRRMQQEPVSKEELQRSKNRLLVNTALAQDSIRSNMQGAATNFNGRGKVVQKEELAEIYKAVTAEDVMEAAQTIFSTPVSVATVGPNGSQLDQDKLANAFEV